MAGTRGFAWVLAAACVAVVVSCPAARAADEKMTIGIVDVQKIYNDAPRIKQYMTELAQFRDLLQKKIALRSQNMMLDENEIKELIDLETKEKKTDAETARAKALQDTERARDAEFKDLQGKSDLTDAERTKLNELQALQSKSKVTREEIAKDYEDQWQKKTIEYDAKAVSDIQEAINKVAADKKYTFVLDKAAVFFGGTNISDEVIANLDRKM